MYQDVWEDGRCVKRGERDCDGRYRLIAEMLPGGPFTLLDVGAYTGYFAKRIAEAFPARVTAVDDYAGLSPSNGVEVIPKRLTAAQLLYLPRHDVALALSVLHHMADWQEALRAMRACRSHLVIEVCDPEEKWMRRAASRADVAAQYQTVKALPGARLLGTSPRTGKDGKTYRRPLYLVPGTVRTLTGEVFSGSGSCSRNMPKYDKGLERVLGYEPFPGSLNVRLSEPHQLGVPAVNWVPPSKRDRQFWRAWIGDLFCHAHVPGKRNHGPDCLELVASVKLRDALGLADGDTVTFDVEAA